MKKKYKCLLIYYLFQCKKESHWCRLNFDILGVVFFLIVKYWF